MENPLVDDGGQFDRWRPQFHRMPKHPIVRSDDELKNRSFLLLSEEFPLRIFQPKRARIDSVDVHRRIQFLEILVRELSRVLILSNLL